VEAAVHAEEHHGRRRGAKRQDAQGMLAAAHFLARGHRPDLKTVGVHGVVGRAPLVPPGGELTGDGESAAVGAEGEAVGLAHREAVKQAHARRGERLDRLLAQLRGALHAGGLGDPP
jgi:hypothetical protein